MCLYIKEKKPRIAKEDIIVLKYVKACDDYMKYSHRIVPFLSL